jgi:hypothetical protein
MHKKMLSAALSAMLVFTMVFWVEYKDSEGKINRITAQNIRFVEGGIILHDDTVNFHIKQASMSAADYRPGSLVFIGSLRIQNIQVIDYPVTKEEKAAQAQKIRNRPAFPTGN